MATPTPVPTRTDLAKKASRYRLYAGILSWLDRHLSWPLPTRPAFELTIPSTISKIPGSIQLYFFTATGTLLSPGEDEERPHTKRPVLIDFHGGGFAIGHPLDDARWIGAVLQKHRDAVVVSVGYRLAPEHPFPIPIEDGVDAVIWLWEHAGQYRLDRGQFVLCGDSAGGNLCLTIPLRLHEELIKRQERQGKSPGIRLAGLIVFYPSTDWSRSRLERDATNPIASRKSLITPEVFKFFDDSYLVLENMRRKDGTDEIDMSHPYLSPGLAPMGLILASYPPEVAIYTCGWDQLLVEGNQFRERLRGFVGSGGLRSVGGMVIEDAVHGFDKRPSFFLGNGPREKMYGDAVRQLEIMWKEKRVDGAFRSRS
jgi:acetyl esterase/lipase